MEEYPDPRQIDPLDVDTFWCLFSPSFFPSSLRQTDDTRRRGCDEKTMRLTREDRACVKCGSMRRNETHQGREKGMSLLLSPGSEGERIGGRESERERKLEGELLPS